LLRTGKVLDLVHDRLCAVELVNDHPNSLLLVSNGLDRGLAVVKVRGCAGERRA
jgi:hypothetical protein